jgi:Protein of unknown function (DUF3297)
MSDAAISDTPPDRLSVDPASPFYDEALLKRGVGIRFKGVEKTNVEEYCVSESWVRIVAGAARDRAGKPILLKLSGKVEPYFQDGVAGAAQGG